MGKERVGIGEVTSTLLLDANESGVINREDIHSKLSISQGYDKQQVDGILDQAACYDGVQVENINSPEKLSEQCSSCPLANDCLVGDVLRGEVQF